MKDFNLNKKEIILIGQNCWFIDSFIIFKEYGFDLKIIKTKNNVWWFESNYNIIKELGGEIIDYSESYGFFENLNLTTQSIVIGGGGFYGGLDSLESLKHSSLEELEILYQISKYNSEKKCGAFILRYFNGDTSFYSKEMINLFNKKIAYVDFLIFDNNLLRDFVLLNIEEAQNKKYLIGWMETPLKRFVYHNNCNQYSRFFLNIGRIISSYPFDKFLSKILFYPFKKSNVYIYKKNKTLSKASKKYNLSGIGDLKSILHDRKMFFQLHKEICFGLSHFYDSFDGSNKIFLQNKKKYFLSKNQTLKFSLNSPREVYYAFVNNPNKDVAYWMNGIIPLVSHNFGHYEKFIEKKMAIMIQNEDDLNAVLNMSEEEIQEYRNNIYKNRDLFTFDTVANNILKEWRNRNLEKQTNFILPIFDNFKNGIVFIIDCNYIPYFSVCLQSLIKNTSVDKLYDVCVLYSGNMEKYQINMLLEQNSNSNISIRFFNIDPLISKNFQDIVFFNSLQHVSKATYYKFFIPGLFKHYQRVVYLDCDMLINTDISKLYDIEFQNYKILAVADVVVNLAHKRYQYPWEDSIIKSCKECGIKNYERYFNAGVMVFNMQKVSILDTYKSFQKLTEFPKPFLVDQDILNTIFQDDVKIIDLKWNYEWTLDHVDRDYKNYFIFEKPTEIYIYHFISRLKPWNSPHFPNANLWWHYARQTPFYEEMLFKNITQNSLDIIKNNFNFGSQSAVEKIKTHLSFKLGKEILSVKENKLKIFILPFTLVFIYIKHKLSNLMFKFILNSNLNLKSAPLNYYSDYQEALKIQNYLSYKLGSLLIKHPLTFIFRVVKVYREWNNGK
ncbi:glycosyltransferase family 8 protein [Campylobacter molothri]|uniref:glycosyltransferase family 8 protein n=1 Tax=Campylobacter molothri TaxID=1032242 RepID=UPI00301E5A48|nr:glycosyltransferase family 8 protein [Campylobacter sp. RM10538]